MCDPGPERGQIDPLGRRNFIVVVAPGVKTGSFGFHLKYLRAAILVMHVNNIKPALAGLCTIVYNLTSMNFNSTSYIILGRIAIML